MKLVVELRVEDGKSTPIPLREERTVIRPSLSSTTIPIGPFTVTLRGDSSLDVELEDIDDGFEANVGRALLESAAFKIRIGTYDLRVVVEDDAIVDCEFAEIDDPTDGDD